MTLIHWQHIWVTNEGYLAISNVDFYCGIHNIDFADGSKFAEFSMRHIQMHEETIKPSEQATVRCDWMVRGNASIVHGDIAIGIKFHPFLIPYQVDRWFRFVAVPRADGIYQWMPKPDKT